MRRLWHGLGWFGAALVALGLLLRWLPITDTFLLGLVGVLPILVVPLVVVAAVAAWRSNGLALQVAVGILAVVVVVTFLRPGSVIGCGPTSAEDEIVLYTHNLLWSNTDYREVAAAITAADADLVVMQEIRPEFQKRLREQPGMGEFRSAADDIDEPVELALWSRWPLTEVELDRVAGRPQLSALVSSPRGEFRLTAVHVAAPVDDDQRNDWVEGLTGLQEVPTTTPSLLAGDFNATVHHAQFRSVLAQGWTDVHRPKGCGFDATWPAAGSRLVPIPLLRLDHVLVTEHWEVLAVDIGPRQGSDHRSVIATVRLRP